VFGRGVRLRKIEMIIKIIDWMSKIMAVALAISGSVLAIVDIIRKLSTKAGEIQLHLQNIIVISGGMVLLIIFYSALQLGLFLAPTVREKKIIYRLGVAILMLPTSVIFFSNIVGVAKMKLLMGIPLNIADTILFSLCSIGLIVHIAQYYLLLGKKQIQTDGYNIEYDQNKEISSRLKDKDIEEPLLVLKYPWWSVCGGIVVFMLVGWTFFPSTKILVYNNYEIILKIGLAALLIVLIGGYIWGTIELFLFKSIKLYKDKIVLSKYFFGQKEMKLEKIYISRSRNFLFIPLSTAKIYVKKKRFMFKEGIFLMEDFTKKKDLKRFYDTLAKLSGRDVKDFALKDLKSLRHWSTCPQKLIKEVDKQ